MSQSAFSLRVFSIYMFALGATLLIVPNMLLALFGVPETHEVWIRIVGVLVLNLGYLIFMASRHEFLPFFRWSVPARLFVPVCFITFVALGFAPPILLVIGAIDAAGALWTLACLRADSLARPALQAGCGRMRSVP